MIQSMAMSCMGQPAKVTRSRIMLQLSRDRQPERAQNEGRHRLPCSRDSRRVHRVGDDVAQLERVGLQIVELMRLVLAYPANVFVSTETHGAVVDVGDPRKRILVTVVLHQESLATALAGAKRVRQ